MVVVLEFFMDVRVLADSEETDTLARRIIEQELARAREAIVDRLTAAGVQASVR